jgi:hypothetical protein
MTFRSRVSIMLVACAVTWAGCGGSGGSTTTNPPAAPAGFSATPGNAQVTLTWSAVTGATSYNVYWSTTAGVTKATGTQLADVTRPYVHTGLTNGTAYYYVVTAVNAGGESAASVQASATPALNPPPAAPADVVATAGNGQVTISWSAVAGAASYVVYWSTSAGVTQETGTAVSGATSPYVHTGRTNGTAYHYVVTAVNANGESADSAEVSATPSTAPYIKVMALSVQGGGSPMGFLEQAEVCTDSECITRITDAEITVNGIALTYDGPNEKYTGLVTIALGGAVNVEATIDGETYTVSGTQFSSYPAVSAPASGATWVSSSAHSISWSGGAPTAGAAYAVGVIDGSGHFAYPQGDHGPSELAIGTHSLTVPANALAAGSHQVMVGIATAGMVAQTSGGIAISGAAAGSGLWLGAIATFVPVTVSGPPGPAAPADVNATAGNGQVTIDWPDVSGATSYNLYWSTSAGVTKANGTQIAGVTSPYVHGDLANGTAYHYVLTAVNENGESADSAAVTATPSATPYISVLVLSVEGGGPPPMGFLEQVEVCPDSNCSTRIADAVVTVNGNSLPYVSSDQRYIGAVEVAPGGQVTVEVTAGGETFTVSGTQFTDFPTVSAPAPSAIWDGAEANTIAWSGGAPTGGAVYAVGVLDESGAFVFPAGGPHGGPASYAIGTTSATVPADTLAAGGHQIMVGIGTAGIAGQASGGIAITGAASGSAMWLGAIATFVPVTVSGPPGPAAPSNVTATPSDGQVTIGWSDVSGATSYNLYWSESAGVTKSTGTRITGVTSTYVHGGLANGTTLHYVVTAVNENGESAESGEVSATPSIAPFIRVMILTMQDEGNPLGFFEQADVCTDSTCNTRITDAVITVNGGGPLAYDSSNHQYKGSVVVALGEAVNVEVTVGGETFTVGGTQFSSFPTVIAPLAGAQWNNQIAQVISWSGGEPTAGAAYAVGVVNEQGGFAFPAGDHGPAEYPIGTTSATVPGESIIGASPAIPYAVMVGIGTAGIIDRASPGIAIAGAAEGSGMWLGAIASFVGIGIYY